MALLVRAVAVAVAIAGAACGARSGLDGIGEPAGDSGLPDAGSGIDAAVGLDASLERLACDGLPLKRPGAVTTVSIPPRMHALGVTIPDPAGILIVGGLVSWGERADEMVFLDLGSGGAQELTVEGDTVVLPDREAAAVFVPAGDAGMVVVIGGTDADDEALDQVFSFVGHGDPSGLRYVTTTLLSPFGPLRGAVAIWDPIEQRIVVHGGATPDGQETLSLRVEGSTSNWGTIVAMEESPPPGVRAMGYDPVRNRAIEITDDEDGSGLAVYELTLEAGSERWARLGEIDFAPSTRGELVWDEASCGFHLLSARRTRCVLEHWILVVGEEEVETVYRGELDLSPSHFMASSVFVPARDQIVVYGSEDCEAPVTPNLVAHEIAFVR